RNTLASAPRPKMSWVAFLVRRLRGRAVVGVRGHRARELLAVGSSLQLVEPLHESGKRVVAVERRELRPEPAAGVGGQWSLGVVVGEGCERERGVLGLLPLGVG